MKDVYGYKEDLATALTNVVENALHWLSYGKTQDPQIRAEVKSHSDVCVIEVYDNGPGIPPEFQSRVFDVGFTLKANGTGLGLSIAREAISRSGGDIELLDTVQGTGFRIIVPIKG